MQENDMLVKLREALNALPQLMEDKENWKSLIINRAKPYTYRAFYQWGEYRICLHRFEVCDPDESLYHPHPWPAAFTILKGAYAMKLGYSPERDQEPVHVAKTLLGPRSMYEIIDPMTWHTVEPIYECFTVMINGKPWDTNVAHEQVKTTKGKDLQKMTPEELDEHLNTFKALL